MDADALRIAATVLRAYGIPASANVCDVVANSVEAGTRPRLKARTTSDDTEVSDSRIDAIKNYRESNPGVGLAEALQATEAADPN